MSIAVACRQSPAVGQSADLYVLWYDNQPIVATSEPSLGHRDGGHLAGLYVTITYVKYQYIYTYLYTTPIICYIYYKRSIEAW